MKVYHNTIIQAFTFKINPIEDTVKTSVCALNISRSNQPTLNIH